MFRWLICSLLLILALVINAQKAIVIANLHDTLQPQMVRLSEVPKPKLNVASQPKAFFTTYTSDDGLAMDAISWGDKSSICDSEGNIWFATQGGGVSKYDGKSFVNFTVEQGLVHNYVRSIARDNQGNLWFGTSGGGVSKYDGKSFKNFTVDQGLADNFVRSIALDKEGVLWFGTNGGVSRYDGKSFVTFTTEQGLAHNTVLSISSDKEGLLWFGTNAGVSKYDGQSFINFTLEDGLINKYVYSITSDNEGNVWFGTSGGVSKYDGKSFMNFTVEDGLAHNYVRIILADKEENLWFGTAGGGVSKYDGKSFENFTLEQGLVDNSVRSIAADKEGNLWFGTKAGVSRYNGKSFVTFTTEQGLSENSVRSIVADKDGDLWFGTYGGVSKYDGKSFVIFTSEQGLASNSVRSIGVDKEGNLWFGTSSGVSKYDGTSFVTFTTKQGLANNSVRSILGDKEGNMWFGTEGGGVSKYDGKSFVTYTSAQGLAHNTVRSIAEDNAGNLWFGTYGGGLSRYDGKSFVNFSLEQGLPNNYVFSILLDKEGNLWFGTNGGGVSFSAVGKLSEKEIQQKIVEGKLFLNYSTENGLSDNVIMGIKETKNGNIIVGTNFGLSLLTGIKEKEIKVEVYNQFTGYPVRDVNGGGNNSGSMFCDGDGVLWVGHGSNGVTRVDLNAVNKRNEPPKVVINKLSLKGGDICFYSLVSEDSMVLAHQEVVTYGKVLNQSERDTLRQRFTGINFDGIKRFYPLPENLVLPFEHNALTIEFNAIETGRNFMVNYQYMLKGMDDGWGPITKKADATYNNLSEGDYSFLLRAQSSWGIWSEPIEYSFKVLPPFYRTWWAYTIYTILIIFLFWILIHLQTRRLKKRQIDLELEVKEATEEIREKHLQLAEHHQAIQDSITYAKRIQEAIMPSISAMDEALKNGFIMYEPKDIVAGDFFWMEPKDEIVYYAAADCTGHGVPGALVSVVCSNALTEALMEGITDTGKLLDRTRDIVIERLAKSGEEVNDGMDISFCALNMKTKELKWSGANNPLWIIRKGAEELEEIQADKQPIGKYINPKIFTEHTLQLNEGDTIYTFTDGYQDQFGGPKGKKFKANRLKQILIDNQHLPLEDQHILLVTTFRDWRGDHEQVDDVCIIGVRV